MNKRNESCNKTPDKGQSMDGDQQAARQATPIHVTRGLEEEAC